MKLIPAALTWEMLERGKWNFAGALLAGNALPMIVLAALKHEGAIDAENDHSLVMIHVTTLLINATMLGGAICSAIGSPSRLSAFPANTSVIVAWQLLPAMIVMGLGSLVTTLTFNALFQLDWPLWGPALFTPVALACFAACFWFTEKSPWHFFACGAPVTCLVGIWFYSRYGMIFQQKSVHMWRDVSAGDVATLLALAGGAYYAATVGVARSRCGEFLKTPEFFKWLARLLDPAPAVGLPFRTPQQAQFWSEWTQKGWGMPALVLFGLPVAFVLWLLFNRKPQDLFDGATAAGCLLTISGLIIGLIFGNTAPADGKFEMGHFLATRPMTTTDMARTNLKVAGISVFIAWALWAAAFLIMYSILVLAHVDPRPQLPRGLGWWFFPMTLLGSWLALTVMATVGQTGRPALFAILFCGIPALIIAAMLFSHYALTPDARTILGQCVTAAVGIIFMFGTAWAFVAARRGALIGPQTVCASIGIWSALCVLVLIFWFLHRNGEFKLSLAASVHVIGLFALVVFPLAAAPLALAWNRNR